MSDYDLSPLWISLRIAGLATGITFGVGTLAAYGMLHYRGRWRSLIEALLLAPLVLPPTMVGFLLLLLFGRRTLLGQLLASLNLSVIFTWYAGVITAAVVALPLMYRTALGAFQQIDPTLVAAARTLGASRAKIFTRVLIPLALPGILAGVTLSFARALGEFGATLMLAGNIPGRTQTLSMAIFFAVQAGDMRGAAISSALVLGLSLGVMTAVNLWFQRRPWQRPPSRPLPPRRNPPPHHPRGAGSRAGGHAHPGSYRQLPDLSPWGAADYPAGLPLGRAHLTPGLQTQNTIRCRGSNCSHQGDPQVSTSRQRSRHTSACRW